MSQGILENIQDYYFNRPDADGLLTGETDGLAWNAASTTQYFPKWMTGTSPSAILVRTDNFTSLHDPQIFLTQSGTSPKYVKSSSGIAWAPHNYLSRSQDFDNTTYWGVTFGSVFGSQQFAPDGTATANILIESGGSGAFVSQSIGSSVIGDNVVTTISCFAKKNTLNDWFLLRLSDGIANQWGSFFNISSGTVGADASSGGGSRISASIVDIGNGWYRCIATGSSAWLGGGPGIRIYTTNADSSEAGTDTATAYIWGAQVNKGYFATDYMKTKNGTKIGIPVSYGQGLLVEPAATNYQIHSDWSSWSTNNATITQNNNVAPDGSTTGMLMTATGADAFLNGILTGGGDLRTYPHDTHATGSVYAKAVGSNTFLRFLACNNSTSERVDVYFNLSTVTVASHANVGSTISYISAAIEDVGGGWYRCSVTCNCTDGVPTTAGFYCLIIAGTTSDGGAMGTGETFKLWGPQVEIGDVATSHIPTLSATVTRGSDHVQIKINTCVDVATQVSSWMWATKYANGSFPAFTFLCTDGSNLVWIKTSVDLQVYDGGIQQCFITPGGYSDGVLSKIAYSAAANSFNVALNGTAGSRDTSGTYPDLSSFAATLEFGSSANGGGDQSKVTFAKIVVLPRTMDDSELVSKSS